MLPEGSSAFRRWSVGCSLRHAAEVECAGRGATVEQLEHDDVTGPSRKLRDGEVECERDIDGSPRASVHRGDSAGQQVTLGTAGDRVLEVKLGGEALTAVRGCRVGAPKGNGCPSTRGDDRRSTAGRDAGRRDDDGALSTHVGGSDSQSQAGSKKRKSNDRSHHSSPHGQV